MTRRKMHHSHQRKYITSSQLTLRIFPTTWIQKCQHSHNQSESVLEELLSTLKKRRKLPTQRDKVIMQEIQRFNQLPDVKLPVNKLVKPSIPQQWKAVMLFQTEETLSATTQNHSHQDHS